MEPTGKLADLITTARRLGYTVRAAGGNAIDINRGKTLKSLGVRVYMNERGGFYSAHRNDVDLAVAGNLRLSAVRDVLELPAPRSNPESSKTRLTPRQAAAVRYILREIKKDGAHTPIYYGEGADSCITTGTARALHRLGLIELHVGPAFTRPARAFGAAHHNWKTIVVANRWLTASPKLIQMLNDARVAKHAASA